MAKASKVSPSLEPYLSSDDEDDDMEELNVASLNMMGELVFHALHKKKFACSNFMKILAFAIESTKTIEKMEEHEREYANEIATLSEALEEQQTTNESLEETFTLELSKVKESRDRALEVAHDFQIKNVELVSAHAKLLEDFELLKNGSRAIESELIKLTESHEKFKALNLIELAKLPSPCAIIDNACATNSTSCEASILKENVELRAQLALLTSNYEKLEESRGKLSSSHDDLLVSHNLLNTCVVTNHVEEIKELEAQVSSLKKDLVKGHEGKQSPNDKSGLGFNSNNKNKSTTHKRKKGQGHVKDPAKIVCFKCKIEGHHVRSCPLKKKPLGEKKQGKRPQDGAHGLPQGQAHGLPRLEERPLPKKDQAKAPVVEKSSEKKEKRRTCYICHEKGHISSFCTIDRTRDTQEDEERTARILGCGLAAFPIRYLGLQLALRPLTKAEWQPLLDQVVKSVPGWQRGLISREGRLVLINSVVAARAVYQMVVAEAPVWLLDEINKWMRAFFWAGKDAVQGGQCLVAWRSICKPKELGGLGVKDLRLQGLALRVRWHWLRRTDPERPWQGLPGLKDPEAAGVFQSLA
ncbi:hypothetical protein QYE76_066119 [Lolium multiflorum]|uniref:CCHC-type domain-containing protein n=1 Tax=Lolium multiflorum TaxID=4521 RepID=A0AAD8SA72_LOLMU|nr:hypothetical protein QYE76_066119 [Lolium multiflorum]